MASNIARIWRGKIGREAAGVARMEQVKQLNEAARVLQDAARARALRRAAREEAKHRETVAAENAAAIILSRGLRSCVAWYVTIEAFKDNFGHYILFGLSFHSFVYYRKNRVNWRGSAVIIQSKWRGTMLRNDFLRAVEAAVAIQAVYRY